MNEKKNESNDALFYFVITLGGLFFLYKLYEHVSPKIIHFWYVYRVQFIGSAIIIGTGAVILLVARLWNYLSDVTNDRGIVSKDATAVLMGRDKKDRLSFLKQKIRLAQMLVTGATSAGKTVSVVLPFILKDVWTYVSTLIMDGKADRETLDQVYANVVAAGRERAT